MAIAVLVHFLDISDKIHPVFAAIVEGIRGFKAAIQDEKKPASTTATNIAND
jgi:hypothetical protein